VTTKNEVERLADGLSGIAMLYQFRNANGPLYGTLTVSQSYCLRILYAQDARTMGELAEELRVPLSTVTGVIDQLEAKGYVKRVDHPADRRSLQVRLTSRGRKLYRAAHEAFLSNIQPLLDGRSAAEREKLISFLSAAVQAIQGWQQNPVKKA